MNMLTATDVFITIMLISFVISIGLVYFMILMIMEARYKNNTELWPEN